MEIKIDKIIRSKRRTVGLEITQDARLVVRAPFRVSSEEIENILLKKRAWIIKKQALLKARKDLYSPKRYVNGESFYYLGRPYRFNLVEEGSIKLTDFLEFPRALLINARQNLFNWYKNSAYEKIRERVERYAKIMGLSYSSLKISDAKKRLGSCGLKGNLNFSWKLIMAPLYVIDYVVVHELAHLEVPNHSRAFWSKVELLLPKYKDAKDWLNSNQHLLEM